MAKLDGGRGKEKDIKIIVYQHILLAFVVVFTENISFLYKPRTDT